MTPENLTPLLSKLTFLWIDPYANLINLILHKIHKTNLIIYLSISTGLSEKALDAV